MVSELNVKIAILKGVLGIVLVTKMTYIIGIKLLITLYYSQTLILLLLFIICTYVICVGYARCVYMLFLYS